MMRTTFLGTFGVIFAMCSLISCAPKGEPFKAPAKPVTGLNKSANPNGSILTPDSTAQNQNSNENSEDALVANNSQGDSKASGPRANSISTSAGSADPNLGSRNQSGAPSAGQVGSSARPSYRVDGTEVVDDQVRAYKCMLRESKLAEKDQARTEVNSGIVKIDELIRQEKNVIKTSDSALQVRRYSSQGDSRDRMSLSLKDKSLDLRVASLMGGRVYLEYRNNEKMNAILAGCRAEKLSKFDLTVTKVLCTGSEKIDGEEQKFSKELMVEPNTGRSVSLQLPEGKSPLEVKLMVKVDDLGITVMKLNFIEAKNKAVDLTAFAEIQNGIEVRMADKDLAYDLNVTCAIKQ